MEDRIKKVIESDKGEVSILHLLDPDERKKIAPFFELVQYQKGSIALKEKETINYIGIVAAGELKFEKKNSLIGNLITLAILGKGAHIGDFSMLPERKSLGQLRAVTDTEILKITHAGLEAFIQENPYTGIKIMKGISTVLSIRLKNAIDRIVLLS